MSAPFGVELTVPSLRSVAERLGVSLLICILLCIARTCWRTVRFNHRRALDDLPLPRWGAERSERALLLPINGRQRSR